MGSSDQAISEHNLDTASAVRAEAVTRSHLFTVFGYSLTKGIGIGKFINSDVSTIGGYNWIIKYYPDGFDSENKNFMSFWLRLESAVSDVKAKFLLTILQQNGVPSDLSRTSGVVTFNSTSDTKHESWGYVQFVKRTEFEASKYLKDDTFTVKCTVIILKGTKLQVINPYGVTVPPANMNQHLISLLESGKGADVTFVVNGDSFKAHRWMLVARSDVFKAELSGGMKENWTDTITVDDIEAPVFKSMLYFIYSDSLPDFGGKSDCGGEKQDSRLMAQHLLVAADRYQLERLRLMCEDVLCKNLCVSNAATTLILAERHNCSQLKAECLRFLSSAEVFKDVGLTDGFHNLTKSCPSILKDIRALNLK